MATAFYIPSTNKSGDYAKLEKALGDVKVTVDSATPLDSSSLIVKRDEAGGFSAKKIKLSAIESSGSTLDIAGDNTTAVLNIGSGTAVQTVNVGNNGAGATVINLGGPGDTVNISGALNNITTTNTQVADKTLVLNAGGLVSSAGQSGIYFEEAGNIAIGYVRVSADRTSIEVKAPARNNITLNQSLGSADNVSFNGLNVTGNGVMTCNSIINLTGVNKTKTIVFAGSVVDDIPAYSLGLSNGILRYDVNNVGAYHIFYGGGNEVFRISGYGNVTCPGTITAAALNIAGTAAVTFPTNTIRRKLVLAEGGVSTNNSDLRFSGLGSSSGTMNYHIAAVVDHHIFYAPTDSTSLTSKELFRISGTGAVSCPGTFTPGGLTLATGAGVDKVLTSNASGQASWQAMPVSSVAATANNLLLRDSLGNGTVNQLNATSVVLPNADVAKRIVFWNKGNLADPLDNMFTGIGTRAGVFAFQINTSNDNFAFYAGGTTATVNTELFRIKGTGAVSCAGTITAGGLTLPSAGGTAATLSHYEEYSYSTAFTGAFDTNNVIFRIVRVGKQVTMSMASETVSSYTSEKVFTNTTPLPPRFRPIQTMFSYCGIMLSDYEYGAGSVGILSDGTIIIYAGALGAKFPSAYAGFLPFTASWIVA